MGQNFGEPTISTRRKFILGTGSALLGAAFQKGTAQSTQSGENITSILQANGFNPNGANSALLAVIGDTHMFTQSNFVYDYYTTSLSDWLVNEINSLTPAVSDLIVAGDLISSHSRSTADPRYSTSYAYSMEEYPVMRQQLERFRSGMRIWCVPGNHDTDREENDAELWRSLLQLPPYQFTTLAGVPVFLLNSGHGGMMDPVQLQWFYDRAASVSKDQEVVIVCHYPTFALFATFAGVKRAVAKAFKGHRAPVWILSGHNHYFREDYYLDGNTRFIQNQVTCANVKAASDGKSPGYGLIALQDGRVVSRIFRSSKVPGFQVLPSLQNVTFSKLRWEFDKIDYPGELNCEGFYDRTGKLLNFTAADVKCHFMRTQQVTWQVNLWRFGGKVREFLISGTLGPTARPSARCAFSTTGPNGPWTEMPFPSAEVSDPDRVYRFTIPTQFLNATTLYVKASTGVAGGVSDLQIAGWGVAASADSLTGYERWIAQRYKTFLLTAETHPAAIPQGSTLTNLELFAFNLAPNTGSISPPEIQGLPSQSAVLIDQTTRFQFARRKAATNPGISCVVEESRNLKNWTPVDPSRFTITPLDETWEEVRMTEAITNGYFRVRVDKTAGSQGGFVAWQNSVAVPAGTPDDKNANLIDDLLEYGFDLSPARGGCRTYDPSRMGDTHGLPTIGVMGRPASKIVYTRMRADASPGVRYVVEQSQNQSDWTQVPQANLSERILKTDGTWEQVECLITPSQLGTSFRVRVELLQPLLQ